jgi:NUMOD3 motif
MRSQFSYTTEQKSSILVLKNIVVPERCYKHRQALMHLVRRYIVHTIPRSTPIDKPHYVYTLSYPESMGGYIFYIGKGTGGRIHEHEQRLRCRTPRKDVNSYKDNVIKKIWRAGKEIVKQHIAFFTTDEDARLYEVALVFFMRPYGHLTNMTDGGDGLYGWHHSEVTIQKLRETAGRPKGFHHSEERKRQTSERHKGKVTPESTKQKMREAALGRVMSDEARYKMSEAAKINIQKRKRGPDGRVQS